jgi:adenylate cyclase
MPLEIERKFLVLSNTWERDAGPGRRFCQGYIARSDGATVRIRRADQVAYITVKGEREGIARPEFEYEIPLDDAEELLASICLRPLIEKVRYCVEDHGLTWEVDVFQGHAKGLVLAEVELEHVDQQIDLPDWTGAEVTDDPRYRNATIAEKGPPAAVRSG